MCDKCVETLAEAQTRASVEALEALANGEEVPEGERLPNMVPLMVMDMGDKVGIVTSPEGWKAIQLLLSVAGNVLEIGSEDDG